jgi:hypothetical protein
MGQAPTLTLDMGQAPTLTLDTSQATTTTLGGLGELLRGSGLVARPPIPVQCSSTVHSV